MSKFIPGMHYAFPQPIPPASTDHIARKMFDIPYSYVSEAQMLDIYWPGDGNGPFPVIVAIHGGAFMGGDKRDRQVTPMLAALSRGYAVVSINYRMSGEAIFPALVYDVKAAIRWIRANARTLLFDANKIATWGGSAGGYLALMAGVSGGVTELEDLELGNAAIESRVQAVVDWFGPVNFLTMDEQLAASGMAPPAPYAHNGAQSPESLILGGTVTEIPEIVRKASPESYVSRECPPVLIQHGVNDAIVPYQQSVVFSTKLRAVAGADSVVLELLDGAGHADPAFEEPQNVKKVLDFLDKSLCA